MRWILIASVTFAGIYGPMLTAAVFARSGALSAAIGGALLVAGIVAGYRASLVAVFEAGVGRALFDAATIALPRISRIADLSAALATSEPFAGSALARLLIGLLAFGAASLAVGIWWFEQKDY